MTDPLFMLDTDTCIFLMRGESEKLKSKVQAMPLQQQMISAVTFAELTYGVQGSGSELGAPILDNQFIGHNFLVKQLADNVQEVEDTAKDIINSIAERDIYTGDQVEVVIVDANGVRVKREPIRRD